MSIEYKEITELEKLDSLADGSYIMVVQDSTAKLISKENAKFGGGNITTFNCVLSTAMNSMENSQIAVQAIILDCDLQHSDGSDVTAQEAYDAYMAGGVRLRFSGESEEAFCDVVYMYWVDSSGASLDPSSVAYVRYGYTMDTSVYEAIVGTRPGSK